MLSCFDGLRDLTVLNTVIHLFVAMILGTAIGLERSYKNRPAGFRTHILVCVGACIASMTGIYLYLNMHLPTDISRAVRTMVMVMLIVIVVMMVVMCMLFCFEESSSHIVSGERILDGFSDLNTRELFPRCSDDLGVIVDLADQFDRGVELALCDVACTGQDDRAGILDLILVELPSGVRSGIREQILSCKNARLSYRVS